MKEKINIADILKDKPVGFKFYSNTFGYISFNGVHKDKVYFFSEDTNAHSVKPNGKCMMVENASSSHLRKCVIGISSLGRRETCW